MDSNFCRDGCDYSLNLIILKLRCDAAVFDNAQALTNGEVSAILAKIVAAKKQEDPAYQPNPLLAKTQEYVERFSGNKNEAVNQQIRE